MKTNNHIFIYFSNSWGFQRSLFLLAIVFMDIIAYSYHIEYHSGLNKQLYPEPDPESEPLQKAS